MIFGIETAIPDSTRSSLLVVRGSGGVLPVPASLRPEWTLLLPLLSLGAFLRLPPA